ncbi:MAG: histidine kinase [Devosia marina]|uniref:histidine kinase n=1 Tax=Devosia marina TaxID=2683198 RepID=UPI000D5D04BC
MPSLIRLLITLIFLGGLVYAGMFALVAFVEPTPKEVSQRIPTRELLGETETNRPGSNLPRPNVTSEPGTGQ